MLRLTKWYLDVVTDQGTALIAYAASLEWSALRIQFASTLFARPDAAPQEHMAWFDVQLPELSGDILRFRHDGLGIAGEWRRAAPPIDATLLDDEAGRLHWSCLLPSADATVTIGGEALSGRGYAECLTLARPIWTLPLRTLHWGRTVTSSHSLVWIGWSGGPPKRWVWLDGVAEPEAEPGEAGIRGLSDDREVRITPFRELCDRRSLQVLSRHLPVLEALPAGPLRGLREIKRLDRGTLFGRGEPVESGWTIHEVVSW